MSTAMEPIPERDSKQASQAEPTVEQMKRWKEDQLLQWIIEKRKETLDDGKIQKLKEAEITGEVFWTYAGDMHFFKNECNLPISISVMLANLSREFKEGVTAGTSTDLEMKKRKRPPHTDITPSPKRTRVDKSSLVISGELTHFSSGEDSFSKLLQQDGHAYFDRTGYIFKLHKINKRILFCRPRRFGKSVTVSMLEHFHGLQYAGEHQSLYKDLDVQKDIDEGKVKPGQYFVLKFDFSEINPSPDLTKANETLITFLNLSIKSFYRTYVAYLGKSFADLCEDINSNEPNFSLKSCVGSVQDVMKQNERLAGIEGVYLLVDEYDAFPNSYLAQHMTAEGHNITWEETAVGRTFRSFWSAIKSLARDSIIQRIFITGISPLSLSGIGSGYNVSRNLSFHEELAGLCGLTRSDLKGALGKFCKTPADCDRYLSGMTIYYNGYHFCMDKKVETVYNTQTCLGYLQRLIEGTSPDLVDPENSEISEDSLRIFAASPSAIRDFETAMRHENRGGHRPFAYGRFKLNFTLHDLRATERHFSWRSLIVYFGGLTFDSEKPTTHLKIPNLVAGSRIALRILEKYDISISLDSTLQNLRANGKLEGTLGYYHQLMVQRDVTVSDLSNRNEEYHRDSFSCCLLKNPFIIPVVEFPVVKENLTPGRIDLVFRVPGWLIVTEWKFYRIDYLDVRANNQFVHDKLTRAKIVSQYNLSDILQLRFVGWDKVHPGAKTIKSWVHENEVSQLRTYIKSTEVQQYLEKESVELKAHLVIIFGSRHILLWDMNKEGNLSAEPCLAEMPDRSNRYYS